MVDQGKSCPRENETALLNGTLLNANIACRIASDKRDLQRRQEKIPRHVAASPGGKNHRWK